MAEICTSYTFIYFATNFSYNAFRSAYQMDHYLSKKKILYGFEGCVSYAAASILPMAGSSTSFSRHHI
jgi:hypothetical protein